MTTQLQEINRELRRKLRYRRKHNKEIAPYLEEDIYNLLHWRSAYRSNEPMLIWKVDLGDKVVYCDDLADAVELAADDDGFQFPVVAVSLTGRELGAMECWA